MYDNSSGNYRMMMPSSTRPGWTKCASLFFWKGYSTCENCERVIV